MNLVVIALAISTACYTSARKECVMPPKIYCFPKVLHDERISVRYEIHNVGSETIHLIDSKSLPYQLLQGSTLTLLYGVNPPDPNLLYNAIEIPLTRPLAPGTRTVGEQILPVKMLRDHYGERPVELRGTLQVHCEVGWGTSPITVATRQEMSIETLLTWQLITSDIPFEVRLP